MLIGIDIGQGAAKVTALDQDGRVLGLVAEDYLTAHPAPGWSEQDPQDWIDAVGRACHRLLTGAVPMGGRTPVEGVGLTSATHHAVLLDGMNRPLRRCIMLTDSRASDQAARLAATHGPLILERARNAVTAGWTLPQLLWIAEEEPDIWTRTVRLAFAKDYLRLALTGCWATDTIDAEGSLLFNTAERAWDPNLCRLVPIPRHWLPPTYAPTDVTGKITREGEALTGIPTGTPVIAGCSDTAAEAVAAGACADGEAVIKLATAGNVNVVTRSPHPHPHWFTYSHPIPSLSYHALGTNSAASSQRWFRDVLDSGSTAPGYTDLEREATTVPPGSGGVLFHPYLLGERAPYWDPDLRASFIGLSALHERGHMLRAILEGVALSLADCLDVFRSHDIAITGARIIGGGARSVLWRTIVADVLGLPLTYPTLSDASAGAALLAGVGVGVYTSPEQAVERTVQTVTDHVPDPRRHAGYTQLLDVYREVQRRLAPIDRALSTVTF